MPSSSVIALRTRAHGGVSRTTVARFVRAASGAPKLHAPDLDDRGWVPSASAEDNRPARGPSVGMTIGGPRIAVRLVRDGLPDLLPLHVTLENKSGDASVVKLASPGPGETLTTQGKGYLADHVYLDSPVSGSTKDDDDADRAIEEAENERLVVGWLAATKKRLTVALEATAKAECAAAGVAPAAGETSLAALEGYAASLPLRDPTRDRIEASIAIARREIDDLFGSLDDQGAPLDVARIQASDRPLEARVEAIAAAIARRRFAGTRPKSSFLLRVHIGSTKGPVIAELGIIALPPFDIEVQPYVVSLGGRSMPGARGLDVLHRLFAETVPDVPEHAASENPSLRERAKARIEQRRKRRADRKRKVATAPAAPPALTYTTFALGLGLVNVIFAPAGVRFFTRPSLVKCFRLADKADAPSITPLTDEAREDDPHGWNTYLDHFNDIFPPGGVPIGRWNWQTGNPATWTGRNDPWLNLLMNAGQSVPAHKLQRDHRLNVWCVRWLMSDGQVHRSGLAIGKGPLSSNQPAAKVPYSVNANTSFEVSLGEDQVGAVCAIDASSPAPDPWHSLQIFARALAHEIGHICGLTHYLGGQKSGDPWGVFDDPWGHRALMTNSEFTVLPPDVDANLAWAPAAGATRAGVLLSLKEYADIRLPAMTPDVLAPDPTGKTVESGALARPNEFAAGHDVELVRETFERGTYFGFGGKP